MQIAEAIAAVDRRQFLPPDVANTPDIEDVPVPFGNGQTVPTALMTELFIKLADLHPFDVVMEVGTGSGYQAAILSKLVKEVHTFEVRDIPACLSQRLPDNVTIYHRDAVSDVSDIDFVADAILVTCAIPGPYRVWKKLLRNGGVLVAPLRGTGEICKYVKDGLYFRDIGPFAYANFVTVESPSSESGVIDEQGL
jgi:protein-L-isoaspartate(D-aspartate) O-methyltransferase